MLHKWYLRLLQMKGGLVENVSSEQQNCSTVQFKILVQFLCLVQLPHD